MNASFYISGLNHVSFIIPVQGEKDKFLISIGRDLAIVAWDGQSEKVSHIEKIYEIDNTPTTLNNRFNDGKCDSTGRLWAGIFYFFINLIVCSLLIKLRFNGPTTNQWLRGTT